MPERRKPKEERPAGCPEWMVTFSDVISLLVTFFVLILTFSTLELEEFKKLAGSLRGSFGVLTPQYQSNQDANMRKDALKLDRHKDLGLEMPFARDIEDLESDVEDLKIQKRLGDDLDINRIDGGLRIRIQADRLFDPGSEVIRPVGMTTLGALADLLGYYQNDILVEGHTDATFTGPSRYPSGYELAGAAARRVAEAFVTEGGIRPQRLGVTSYGASRPIATNDTPAGRARNRRIDILVLEYSAR